MNRQAPLLGGRALVIAAVVGVVLAGGASGSAGADGTQRLPRVAPGKLLPNARGLVLGRTTRAELLSRWGPATRCSPYVRSCTWVVGLGKNFFTEPGGVSDAIVVVFDRTTKRAATLSLTTSSWQRSRLRGWKLPGAIGIGSPFPAVERAFPTLHWSSGVSTTKDGSVWLVDTYDQADGRYRLLFTVDAGAKRAAAGHVVGLDLVALDAPRRASRSDLDGSESLRIRSG